MSAYRETVNLHYGHTDLSARILDRLREAGKDLSALTRDDLSSFDEFHTGGRTSTRELARLARLQPGTTVLDIGSGIGGPARTLASEFGCMVVGIDLTEEFTRAATLLTDLVGLQGSASFRTGDALALPFGDASFDAAWSQNTVMNIDDKKKLFSDVFRVVRRIFALEAVVADRQGPLHFPTFWASSPDLSFLVTADETESLLRSAGFTVSIREDTTDSTLELAVNRKHPRQPILGRSVIVTKDLEQKLENSIRNIEDGYTRTVRIVCHRP